jgi:hypothetical protein
MFENIPDKKPDVEAAAERGERIALMEPLVLGEGSRYRAALTDLALELGQRSGDVTAPYLRGRPSSP